MEDEFVAAELSWEPEVLTESDDDYDIGKIEEEHFKSAINYGW